MNMRGLVLAGVTVGLVVGAAAPAQAITVELDFTADFPAGSPDTIVTGQFIYQAASVTSPVDSLTSVDLTIGGHTYSLAELGSKTLGPFNLIGSTSPGLGTVDEGVDSFFLEYDPIAGTPINFPYSTSSFPAIADAVSVPHFSIRAAPVPEPATWALFLTGFLGAGALAARRRLARGASNCSQI
jgi:hypothetical protein